MESLIALIMVVAVIGMMVSLFKSLDTNEEQNKDTNEEQNKDTNEEQNKDTNEELQIFPNEPKSITKEMLMKKAESERALQEKKEREQEQQQAKKRYERIYNIFVSYPDFEFSFDEIETLLYPYNHYFLRGGLSNLRRVELIKYNTTTEKYSLQ